MRSHEPSNATKCGSRDTPKTEILGSLAPTFHGGPETSEETTLHDV